MSCVRTPTRGRGEGVDVDDIEGSGSVVVGGVGVCVYPGYTIEGICVYPGYIREGVHAWGVWGVHVPARTVERTPERKEKERGRGSARGAARGAVGRRGGGASACGRVGVCREGVFFSRRRRRLGTAAAGTVAAGTVARSMVVCVDGWMDEYMNG